MPLVHPRPTPQHAQTAKNECQRGWFRNDGYKAIENRFRLNLIRDINGNKRLRKNNVIEIENARSKTQCLKFNQSDKPVAQSPTTSQCCLSEIHSGWINRRFNGKH